MITCKKCNIDLTDRESRNVAQWYFCVDCFNALMSEAEGRKRSGAGKTTPAASPGRTETAPPGRCFVCEKQLGKNEGHDMLGFTFCDACYGNLVKVPAMGADPETLSPAPAPEIKEKEAVAQVRVDFISRTKCHKCGKVIRAIAGKQFGENLYCPDCYFNLPEIKSPSPAAASAGPEQATPDAAASDVSAAAQDYICQACRRRVFREDVKSVEGFLICSPCLATDRDMALEIARAGHRRLLEEIRNKINQ